MQTLLISCQFLKAASRLWKQDSGNLNEVVSVSCSFQKSLTLPPTLTCRVSGEQKFPSHRGQCSAVRLPGRVEGACLTRSETAMCFSKVPELVSPQTSVCRQRPVLPGGLLEKLQRVQGPLGFDLHFPVPRDAGVFPPADQPSWRRLWESVSSELWLMWGEDCFLIAEF